MSVSYFLTTSPVFVCIGVMAVCAFSFILDMRLLEGVRKGNCQCRGPLFAC